MTLAYHPGRIARNPPHRRGVRRARGEPPAPRTRLPDQPEPRRAWDQRHGARLRRVCVLQRQRL